MSVLDFEFEKPGSLQYEQTIDEGDKTVVYTAQACNLYFDGTNDIRGGVSLKKEICWQETFDSTRIRFCRKLWPFKLVTEAKSRQKRKLVWQFASTMGSHHYYFYEGRPSRTYRNVIKGIATEKGHILTDKLLDLMFGPIDAEIKKLYEDIKAFEERHSDVINTK